MPITTPWKTLSYGTSGDDLAWCDAGNFPDTGRGTLGAGGIGKFRWRRDKGICFYQLLVYLGTGFSLPTSGGGGHWYFESPPDLVAATTGLVTSTGTMATQQGGVLRFGQSFWVNNADGSGVDALALYYVETDVSVRNVNNVQPYTWAAGALINASGWVECLDN